MLLINNESVSSKDFIKHFGLADTLGLTEDFFTNDKQNFKIAKSYTFEFLPEVMSNDRLGMYDFNRKAASARFIPREYRTRTVDGESVEVRFTTALPRPNSKGVMEYPISRKKEWRFEKSFVAGEEDEFLFMLANPECQTSNNPSTSDKVYYRLKDRMKEVRDNIQREEKLDECYAYIKSLSGQALVIKALGAKVENAHAIYDNEGEAGLRLVLRQRAQEHPFAFLKALTADSSDVSGRIKYAVQKAMVEKVPTGVPNLEVWQFADGSEICKVTNNVDAYQTLQDTLVYNADLYQKLGRMIDKDLSPEAVAQLKKKTVTTEDKINALLDAEMLTYDLKLKSVYWVVKGEIVDDAILKAKKAWKSELVEAFDKDKSLTDMLNKKYAEANKKVSV